MDLMDRMLEHDRWATWTLLNASRDLNEEQLDAQFDIGLGTLRATFSHIIVNTGFWTALMTGQSTQYRELAGASISELVQEHERTYANFEALARRLRNEQRLDNTYRDHYDVNKSFAGTVLHVVLHNAEHRTEAVHILQRLGLPNVPEVDHGLWDYEMHNT